MIVRLQYYNNIAVFLRSMGGTNTMVEIKTGRELLLENVLSFRGIVNQKEIQQIGMDCRQLQLDIA